MVGTIRQPVAQEGPHITLTPELPARLAKYWKVKPRAGVWDATSYVQGMVGPICNGAHRWLGRAIGGWCVGVDVEIRPHPITVPGGQHKGISKYWVLYRPATSNSWGHIMQTSELFSKDLIIELVINCNDRWSRKKRDRGSVSQNRNTGD